MTPSEKLVFARLTQFAGGKGRAWNPVSGLYMLWMGVFSETGGLRLLRREETLLSFGDLEKTPLSGPVIPWHITILQLN